MLRDRGCAFPGCTHTRFLHGHHIRHWLHGGETSVDNLALLCTVHHHLVHEGGWTIVRGADGELVFTSPVGRGLPAQAAAGTGGQQRDVAPRMGGRAWRAPGPGHEHAAVGRAVPDYDIAVCALLEPGDLPKAS